LGVSTASAWSRGVRGPVVHAARSVRQHSATERKKDDRIERVIIGMNPVYFWVILVGVLGAKEKSKFCILFLRRAVLMIEI
jgi:hypothetical protein